VLIHGFTRLIREVAGHIKSENQNSRFLARNKRLLSAAHFKLGCTDMKTRTKIAIIMGISSLATLKLMSGPAVGITVQVPAPPPPSITVTVGIPDTYVWDGYEYVGVVGSQYYYLGSGNVWVVCDPGRVARFYDWERAHADWREHAIRNEHFRRDAEGHDHPWHDDHGNGHDHGH
jgi:hypothetical protein